MQFSRRSLDGNQASLPHRVRGVVGIHCTVKRLVHSHNRIDFFAYDRINIAQPHPRGRIDARFAAGQRLDLNVPPSDV